MIQANFVLREFCHDFAWVEKYERVNHLCHKGQSALSSSSDVVNIYIATRSRWSCSCYHGAANMSSTWARVSLKWKQPPQCFYNTVASLAEKAKSINLQLKVQVFNFFYTTYLAPTGQPQSQFCHKWAALLGQHGSMGSEPPDLRQANVEWSCASGPLQRPSCFTATNLVTLKLKLKCGGGRRKSFDW